jgi:undecaprenyl diphosphate synthase
MDGNGRWAQMRGHSRIAGHREGAEATRRVVRAAAETGVPYLTLFAFSAENWKRSTQEIDQLMWLLRTFIQRELDDLHAHGVCLQVIGDQNPLPRDLQEMLDSAEQKTRANQRIKVILALNYGGRQDIVAATKRLATCVAADQLGAQEISTERFARALSTWDVPDPDLLVRTSGEKRISNFLLWQCAYAEMFFLDKLWPDVSEDDVHDMIETYRRRTRRFGGIEG